jgi:voltage-gated potassium channel
MDDLTTQAKNTLFWSVSLLTLSIIPTILLYFLEKDINPDINGIDSIYWWWIVTVSSVGYGDITPVTVTGKLLGSIVIVASLFIFALTVVEISTLMKMYIFRERRGFLNLNYKNHIVIVNYNPTLTFLVRKIRKKLGKDKKIVLISDKLRHNPLPGQIDFINADPIHEFAHRKANIYEAKLVIFLTKDEYKIPESISIMLANEIEQKKPDIITAAELIDQKYKQLVEKTDIDDYFTREELIKEYLDEEITTSDIDRVLEKAYKTLY